MILEKNKTIFSLMLIVIGILVLGFLFAYPVLDSGIKDSLEEDQSPVYTYNFTQNVTGSIEGDLEFSIYSINSTEHNFPSVSDYFWITINSSTGVMTINSTRDNETGNFTISISVIDDSEQGTIVSSDFIINATNDAPKFTNINIEYNLTQNQSFSEYLNASDEEEHYPLFFNISFFNNCSLASWSTRGAGNCSLFTLANILNISALMNFTPTRNDVGIYWANISVMDNGNNSVCPHKYCDNSTYQQNKTTYYSQVIVFNVFSTLEVNVSDCQNKIFQENQTGTCQINITTKDEIDLLNISSIASLRNYQGSISNISWFYPLNQTTTSNFSKTIFINITPQKTEIGNWTINFTVQDLTAGENITKQIYVYVNRTYNDVPELADIANVNTSINLLTIINLTVYDDDLLIPDKLDYNETTTFTTNILNRSNLSQELNISNFTVEILYMPVAGTNRTEARIKLTANQSEAGDYTINITVNDTENSINSKMFNLSIITNTAPIWNATSYYFELTVNSSFGTTENFFLNLTDGYVNDTDANDALTFTNTSAMPSFSLTSYGIINFTPYKQDVDYWSFNVIATDSLGLLNTTTFIFNISNINTPPIIGTPISVVNATVDASSNINATEDNLTIIRLWIEDDDFKITNKSVYNESFIVNLTIQGINPNLFTFSIDTNFPTPGNNKSKYEAIFTPNKTDVGVYNITINITDLSNSSDILNFNLTVFAINDGPILITLTNKTSAVNRTFYYDINASDEEDGNDSQGNLTFSYNFINGTDFINNNETIFNITSGKLNITFNNSHSGIYRINITVNDSGGSQDSDDFWLFVYDYPTIIFPVVGENFTLQENIESNITFQVNHSIGDNLTYLFYLGDVLKNNTIYYGNKTNLTWLFTPNFTDETYGQFENLTLIVYPANTALENNTEINTTIVWNINITHTNSPVSFSGYIGDKQANYNQNIIIDLSDYFSDIDYTDSYYNQTINFTVLSNTSPSYISTSISSNWSLTLSSSIAIKEMLNITGNDSFSIATSNLFEVEFITPVTVTVPSGGGGTTIVPISLKILMPSPVSAYQKDRIVLPITLYNDGKRNLLGINLTSMLVKDNLISDDITISFDKYYLSSLGVGEKENITLTIDVNTEEMGTFEITINADVENPDYNDWGKLYLTIKEGINIEEKLLFTEELILNNPECIELREVVNEAKRYFEKGDFINTILKMNQAIDACKNAVSQPGRAKIREKTEDKVNRYLFIGTLFTFFIGISYYSYRRIKLRRSSFKKNELIQEKIKTKTFLVILVSLGLISLFFAVKDPNLTGFAINNISLFNYDKTNFSFIFVVGILGLLIFLNINKIGKFIKFTTKNIQKKYSSKNKNKIKNLIKKKVYVASGDYIGKIQDVIIGKNKIDKLKIKLDIKSKKKNKVEIIKKKHVKGIIIKYNQIKNIGQIVIIKRGIIKVN